MYQENRLPESHSTVLAHDPRQHARVGLPGVGQPAVEQHSAPHSSTVATRVARGDEDQLGAEQLVEVGPSTRQINGPRITASERKKMIKPPPITNAMLCSRSHQIGAARSRRRRD